MLDHHMNIARNNKTTSLPQYGISLQNICLTINAEKSIYVHGHPGTCIYILKKTIGNLDKRCW